MQDTEMFDEISNDDRQILGRARRQADNMRVNKLDKTTVARMLAAIDLPVTSKNKIVGPVEWLVKFVADLLQHLFKIQLNIFTVVKAVDCWAIQPLTKDFYRQPTKNPISFIYTRHGYGLIQTGSVGAGRAAGQVGSNNSPVKSGRASPTGQAGPTGQSGQPGPVSPTSQSGQVDQASPTGSTGQPLDRMPDPTTNPTNPTNTNRPDEAANKRSNSAEIHDLLSQSGKADTGFGSFGSLHDDDDDDANHLLGDSNIPYQADGTVMDPDDSTSKLYASILIEAAMNEQTRKDTIRQFQTFIRIFGEQAIQDLMMEARMYLHYDLNHLNVWLANVKHQLKNTLQKRVFQTDFEDSKKKQIIKNQLLSLALVVKQKLGMNAPTKLESLKADIQPDVLQSLKKAVKKVTAWTDQNFDEWLQKTKFDLNDEETHRLIRLARYWRWSPPDAKPGPDSDEKSAASRGDGAAHASVRRKYRFEKFQSQEHSGQALANLMAAEPDLDEYLFKQGGIKSIDIFKELQPRTWLSDATIDAFLQLVRQTVTHNVHIDGSLKHLTATLEPQARLEQINKNVTKLFLPVNIHVKNPHGAPKDQMRGTHWYFLVFDKINGEITVCDSGGEVDRVHVNALVDQLLETNYFNDWWNHVKNLVVDDKYPKQHDGVACGVYVSIGIWRLATNQTFDKEYTAMDQKLLSFCGVEQTARQFIGRSLLEGSICGHQAQRVSSDTGSGSPNANPSATAGSDRITKSAETDRAGADVVHNVGSSHDAPSDDADVDMTNDHTADEKRPCLYDAELAHDKSQKALDDILSGKHSAEAAKTKLFCGAKQLLWISDMLRLVPGTWLNDAIIKSFLNLITLPANYAIADTLTKEFILKHPDTKIKSNDRKVAPNITKVFMPINETKYHWYFLIFDKQLHTVTVCDSLTRKNHAPVAELVAEIVKHDYLGWPDWEYDLTFEESYPQQDNGISCGVFVAIGIWRKVLQLGFDKEYTDFDNFQDKFVNNPKRTYWFGGEYQTARNFIGRSLLEQHVYDQRGKMSPTSRSASKSPSLTSPGGQPDDSAIQDAWSASHSPAGHGGRSASPSPSKTASQASQASDAAKPSPPVLRGPHTSLTSPGQYVIRGEILDYLL